jgi:hypothetical protein
MAKQHTEIPMQPIGDNEAQELAHALTDIGISDRDRSNLMTLICGIAAIDNEVTRQEIAAEAVHAIYLNLDGIYRETGAFVASIYAKMKKGRKK